jgi:parvulin-like peptidyl-prolyl isomerase
MRLGWLAALSVLGASTIATSQSARRDEPEAPRTEQQVPPLPPALTDDEIRPQVLSWSSGEGTPIPKDAALRIQVPEFLRTPEMGDGRVDVPVQEYARWLLRVNGETLARDYVFDIFLREREAKRLGVSVTPEEVRAEWERLQKLRVDGAFQGNLQGWIDEMQRTGRSLDGVMAQRGQELYSELLGKRVAAVGRKIPEELVVRDWELRYGRHGLRHDLQMMFFKVIQQSAEAGEHAAANQERFHQEALAGGRQRANVVRQRLLAGEEFAQLARKESDDYTREQTMIGTLPDNRAAGGEQKGFVHYGWPPAFLDAVDALKIGELSEPVYANGGYWLVRRVATRETPLASVRAEIEQALIERGPESYEVALVFDPLMEKAKIELSPDLLQDMPQLEGPNQDAVAFTVDGEPVPRGKYALWLLRMRGEELVSAFVEHYLVEQKARQLGITATDAEVRERSEEMMQFWMDAKFKGHGDRFETFLAESGRTKESYLSSMDARMRIDVLIDKIFRTERAYTEEDIKRRWEQIYGKDGRSFDARMILLGLPVMAPPKPDATAEDLSRIQAEAVASTRQLGADIVRRLRSGEDFGALAEKYSKDVATSKRGGAMVGGRFRPESWEAGVVKAVTELAPGEVSDPIELIQGFAIFERGPDRVVALDEVREELLGQLREQRTSDVTCSYYRNELYKQSRVQILPAMNQ